MNSPVDVTRLLMESRCHRPDSMERLFPLVYEQLRELASRLMRRERPDHTLQATALVHEAYLKLVDQSRAEWRDRTHFYAVAAQALRRILIDHARGRGRQKRGGGAPHLPLREELIAAFETDVDLLALDEALTELARDLPQEARIVEMRFFAGMTVDDVAAELELSRRTVERRWRFARAWLHRSLTTRGGNQEQPGDDS